MGTEIRPVDTFSVPCYASTTTSIEKDAAWKPTVAVLINKFSVFHGMRKLITVFGSNETDPCPEPKKSTHTDYFTLIFDASLQY